MWWLYTCNLGIEKEELTGFWINILQDLQNEEAAELKPKDVEILWNPGALGNAVSNPPQVQATALTSALSHIYLAWC